jgi:hypothetical protein
LALTIRVSALPSAQDCERRTAGKVVPKLVAEAGFSLRQLAPSIGAAVGTATHAAVSFTLKRKIETGELPPLADALENAFIKFREEIAPGAEWDDTTPNRQIAEYQVEQLTRAYLPIAATVSPILVEAELRAQVAPGVELVGHVDLYATNDELDDLKTGALVRPYQSQLGGYSLLLKSQRDEHGAALYGVKRAGTTFIKRVRKGKPQPEPIRTSYNVHSAEMDAHKALGDFVRDIQAFKKTGSPWEFPSNPNSLMCSPRYCPAFGTKFCTSHLPKENDHGSID